MSLIAELTRPFWLPGIHAVSVKPTRTIAGWIAGADYQVYTPLVQDSATLSFATSDAVVEAFATDASRFVVAALESVEGIAPSGRLPKATGWLLLRSYYAAFFAAHAILRMFGRSASQLGAGHLGPLLGVADAYGQRGTQSLSRGIYEVVVDTRSRSLTVKKRTVGDGGSHAVMWAMFAEFLADLSSDILRLGGAPTPTQRVSAKLIELRDVLSAGGGANGNWLSQVRNRVNYELAFGAWYPYAERQPYYDGLFTACGLWTQDPINISVWPQRGRELQRFVEAGALIVAICRALSEDMAARHPTSRSFHRFGAVALLNRLAQA